jgi:putative membrane protein
VTHRPTDRAGQPAATDPTERAPLGALAVRGALGGTLMGLANLVPGISGGTMLLASGVYPAFIRAIAEVTTLRLRLRALVLLGSVGLAAALAILLLAGPTRVLVLEHRWVMYSLFIGLTLGGVPLVWRLARPATPPVVAGALVGLVFMVLLAVAPTPGADGPGAAMALLLVAGVAGAGAMILPGVSGGYLLLLLGQYLPILGAVDRLKEVLLGLRTEALDTALLGDALAVLVPVGVGVAVGLVAVSNLLRWTLDRFPKPTLGLLLGLLLGAVAGLWPFRAAVPPEPGDLVRGRVWTEARAAAVDPADWPLAPFRPDPGQVLAALALVAAGFSATLGVDRVGRAAERVTRRP